MKKYQSKVTSLLLSSVVALQTLASATSVHAGSFELDVMSFEEKSNYSNELDQSHAYSDYDEYFIAMDDTEVQENFESQFLFDFETQTIVSYIGTESHVVVPCEFVDVDGNLVTPLYIGEYAFAYNTNVLKVELPDTILSIGVNAFYKCENLETIKMSNMVDTISYGAFSECKSLKEIELPNVKTIGSYAFAYTESLTKIELYEGFESFSGNNIFYNSKLSEIIIPSSTNYISSEAFYGSKLETIYVNACFESELQTIIAELSYDNANVIYTDFGVIEQSDFIFDIQTKTIVEFIGTSKSAVIPEYFVTFNDNKYAPKVLADSLFEENKRVLYVQMPNSITEIGDYVFAGCDNLAYIGFSENIEKVGLYAFAGCTQIDFIDLINVKIVENYAFSYINDEVPVYLPANFEGFNGENIFENSKALIIETEVIEEIIPETYDEIIPEEMIEASVVDQKSSEKVEIPEISNKIPVNILPTEEKDVILKDVEVDLYFEDEAPFKFKPEIEWKFKDLEPVEIARLANEKLEIVTIDSNELELIFEQDVDLEGYIELRFNVETEALRPILMDLSQENKQKTADTTLEVKPARVIEWKDTG